MELEGREGSMSWWGQEDSSLAPFEDLVIEPNSLLSWAVQTNNGGRRQTPKRVCLSSRVQFPLKGAISLGQDSTSSGVANIEFKN